MAARKSVKRRSRRPVIAALTEPVYGATFEGKGGEEVSRDLFSFKGSENDGFPLKMGRAKLKKIRAVIAANEKDTLLAAIDDFLESA